MIISSHRAPSTKIHDEIREMASNAIMDPNYSENGYWLEFGDKNLFCYLKPIISDGKIIGFTGGRFRTFSFIWGVDNIKESIKK